MTTLREARIILPVQDNDGHPLAGIHAVLQSRLIEAFGGYTAIDCRGGWQSPNGTLHNDPGTAYDIACADDPSTEATLRALAHLLLIGTLQEAIYLRLPSGAVEFATLNSSSKEPHP
jgi:hypothetical protein